MDSKTIKIDLISKEEVYRQFEVAPSGGASYTNAAPTALQMQYIRQRELLRKYDPALLAEQADDRPEDKPD